MLSASHVCRIKITRAVALVAVIKAREVAESIRAGD